MRLMYTQNSAYLRTTYFLGDGNLKSDRNTENEQKGRKRVSERIFTNSRCSVPLSDKSLLFLEN